MTKIFKTLEANWKYTMAYGYKAFIYKYLTQKSTNQNNEFGVSSKNFVLFEYWVKFYDKKPVSMCYRVENNNEIIQQ